MLILLLAYIVEIMQSGNASTTVKVAAIDQLLSSLYLSSVIVFELPAGQLVVGMSVSFAVGRR